MAIQLTELCVNCSVSRIMDMAGQEMLAAEHNSYLITDQFGGFQFGSQNYIGTVA